MVIDGQLIRRVHAIGLILFFIIYNLLGCDCTSTQSYYLKEECAMRIKEIDKSKKTWILQGISEGKIVEFEDKIILLKSNGHKIAIGDSIWKVKNTPFFYVLKPNNSLDSFARICRKLYP